MKAIFEAAKTGGIAAGRQAVLDSALLASATEHPEIAAALTKMVGSYSGWHFENRDPARWAEPDARSRYRAGLAVGRLDQYRPPGTSACWPISGQVGRRTITLGRSSNLARSDVTTTRPVAWAVAAMMRSWAPRGRPPNGALTPRYP